MVNDNNSPMVKKGMTQIQVSIKTAEDLKKLGKMDDTYETVIRKLIDEAKNVRYR